MKIVGIGNSFIRAAAVFSKPIFFWSPEIASRFFRALYVSLNDTLYIQPTDLIALGGQSLADCSASLRVFGGSSTLTLKANGLIAEFPTISAERLQFTNQVILRGYSAIREEFKELEIASVESNVGHHLKLDDADGYDALIRTSCGGGILTELLPKGIVLQPALRFRVTSEDGIWSARVTVEKSEAAESDLFLSRELIITKLDQIGHPQQQFDVVTRVDEIIYRMLDLKVGD
jgi:hypothetical protein